MESDFGIPRSRFAASAGADSRVAPAAAAGLGRILGVPFALCIDSAGCWLGLEKSFPEEFSRPGCPGPDGLHGLARAASRSVFRRGRSCLRRAVLRRQPPRRLRAKLNFTLAAGVVYVGLAFYAALEILPRASMQPLAPVGEDPVREADILSRAVAKGNLATPFALGQLFDLAALSEYQGLNGRTLRNHLPGVHFRDEQRLLRS